jgi:replicative DNA helicase
MRVIRADNGFEVALDELMRTGERPYVWSIDERKRLVARRVNGRFAVNTREVVQLRLASGRQLEVTAGYSLLCLDGWIPLTELNVGSRLAALRRLASQRSQGGCTTPR